MKRKRRTKAEMEAARAAAPPPAPKRPRRTKAEMEAARASLPPSEPYVLPIMSYAPRTERAVGRAFTHLVFTDWPDLCPGEYYTWSPQGGFRLRTQDFLVNYTVPATPAEEDLALASFERKEYSTYNLVPAVGFKFPKNSAVAPEQSDE